MNSIKIGLKSAHIDYFNFITNKKVIFVAPSPALKGKKMGEWIDSFDVVVRTAHFPVILFNDKSLIEDYGSRCTVLYANVQYYNNTHYLFDDIYKFFKIKYMCVKRCNDADYRRLAHYTKVRSIQKTASRVNKEVATPLMGSILLCDLAEQQPAELVATGMTFYAEKDTSKSYSSYVSGYIPEKIQQQNKKLGINQGEGHDLRANALYIKSLYDRAMLTLPDIDYENLLKGCEL